MIRLSKRQFQIVKTLEDHNDFMTADDLCLLLDISERTLRNEISDINKIANCQLITSSKKSGYCISKHDRPEDLFSYIHVFDEDNCFKEILIMLFLNKSISIREVCDKCFVSESYVYSIIKENGNSLKRFNLELIKKKNELFLKGNEFDKRRMYSHFFYNELNERRNIKSSLFGFEKLDKLIREKAERNGIIIDDIYVKNIMINLAVCIIRGKENRLERLETNPDFASDEEKRFVTDLCDDVKKEYGTETNDNDYLFLLLLVRGCINKKLNHEQDQLIDRDFFKTIRKLLDKTFRFFQIEIDYTNFFDGFVVHVQRLIIRCKSNAAFKNDLTENLKNSFPFVYEVAVYFSSLVEREFMVSVNDDEIGLIAIYIGMIVENTNTTNKIKTVCLCPRYGELRDLFINRLEHNFGSKIEIRSVVSDIDEVDDDFDLMISTVNIANKHKNVFVSPLLSNQDIKMIEETITKIEKRKDSISGKDMLGEYLSPELIVIEDCETDKDTVIRMMSEKLISAGYVPESFTDSVIKRESLSSTMFFNRFALPHALDIDASKTKICLYINNRPISWGEDEPIRVVMMIASNSKEYNRFKELYISIVNMFRDEQAFLELLKMKTIDDIYSFLEEQII